MSNEDLVARASIEIAKPAGAVWNALIDPAAIKQYFFGSEVESAWKVGSPIYWRGSWNGKPYEDKGEILEFDPEKKLSYSHYSPMTGKPDMPENYNQVTVELNAHGDETLVQLSQLGSANEEERRHSEQNWNAMLAEMKRYLENG